MQFKIPQNVGIEDRIVGPLTLRQLIILAVGTGISYIFFAILSKLYELNIIEYIIIALPAMLATAFALIKINDITLVKFLFLFLEFSIKPKKRVWNHRGISALISPDLEPENTEKNTSEDGNILEMKAKKAANLRELTRVLDSGSFEHLMAVEHEDIDAIHDDDLVTQAYFGHKKDESATKNMYWRTKDAHMRMLDVFAKLPITKLTKDSKEAVMAQQEITKIKEEVSQMRKQSNGQKTMVITKPVHIQKTLQAKSVKPEIKPLTPAKQNTLPKIQAKPADKPVTAVPVQKQPMATQPNTSPQLNPQPQKDAMAVRRRKRRVAQPVRTDNHVNTTNKNAPAEYIAKNQPIQKPIQQNNKKPKTNKNIGEFDFRELKKGEIEINLD